MRRRPSAFVTGLVHVDRDPGCVARREDHVFVGQRHALPLGHDFGGVPPGGRKTGGSANGHRVTRGRGPDGGAKAAAPDVRRGGRRFHAREADGPLDRRPAARRRAGRARQPGLENGLVAERQVTVNVVVLRVIVGRRRPFHRPGPVLGGGHLESVAAVLVAVAVRAGPAATRVPRLAVEHRVHRTNTAVRYRIRGTIAVATARQTLRRSTRLVRYAVTG